MPARLSTLGNSQPYFTLILPLANPYSTLSEPLANRVSIDNKAVVTVLDAEHVLNKTKFR